MDSSNEQELVEELMADFGLDAELAAGMVSLAKRVNARDGRFTLEGMLGLACHAYEQDPLLRLYWNDKLPGTGP